MSDPYPASLFSFSQLLPCFHMVWQVWLASSEGKRNLDPKEEHGWKKKKDLAISLSLSANRRTGENERKGTLAPRSEAAWLVDALIITVIRKERGRRIMAVDFCMLENSPHPLPLPLSPPPLYSHSTYFSDTKSFSLEDLSPWRPCTSACITRKSLDRSPMEPPQPAWWHHHPTHGLGSERSIRKQRRWEQCSLLLVNKYIRRSMGPVNLHYV